MINLSKVKFKRNFQLYYLFSFIFLIVIAFFNVTISKACLSQSILGQEHNFEKHSYGMIDTLGVEYDYKSIMHYGRTTFTRNGQDTIQRIDDPKGPLGGIDFSQIDLIEINALYNCHKYGGTRSLLKANVLCLHYFVLDICFDSFLFFYYFRSLS